MGDATPSYFLSVLHDSSQRLAESGVDHVLIGGLATVAIRGTPWETTQDIDYFIREEDAEPLLDLFAAAGYATHRRDPKWIVKVAQPNVTVDLIFRAAETITLDDEHLARSTTEELDGVRLPVASIEDLVVAIALIDSEERQGHWYQCIELLRIREMDWEYLGRRAVEHGAAKLLSLYLYASTRGVDVPREAMADLARHAIG